MGKSHTARNLTVMLAMLSLLAGVMAVGFIRAGQTWESWPILDRVSGRQEFRRYVADPIPGNVYDIHGGYSGFPRGEITTYFHFRGELENGPLLRNWKELDYYDSNAPFAPFVLALGADHVYMQSVNDGYRYLLIADERKTGLLYIP